MRGPLRALGSRLRALKLFNRRWIIDPAERARHDTLVGERMAGRIPAGEPDRALEPVAESEQPEP